MIETTTTTTQPIASTRTPYALIAPALAGGAVAVSLGVYGRVHGATFAAAWC